MENGAVRRFPVPAILATAWCRRADGNGDLSSTSAGDFEGRRAQRRGAAAYRHRAEMKLDTEENVRTLRYTGITEDLVFAELALPPDAPKWIERLVEGKPVARASEALWNAVEQAETRVNAQLAREIVLALPIELTREQNVELVRDYVAEAFTTRGMIADWVYHEKEGNPHIHVMLTMNPLTADGFGKRLVPRKDADGNIVRVNGQIQYENWAGDKGLLKLWRKQWADNANRHLARAGLDVRIDERSHKELGIEITPTTHLGPGGHAIALRQGASELKAQADEARRDAARKLLDQPDGALALITNERSVFTEADMTKLVARYVDDEAESEKLLDAAFNSDALIQLVPDSIDPDTGVVLTEARYTTQEMLDIERAMMDTARRLRLVEGFGVSEKSVDRALADVAEARGFALSEEQAEAVRYLGRDRAVAVVVGFAGAGKSTMLEAARRAWEAEGRRVIGGALAGKAAAELQKSSGITGRTLASWEFAWNNDREVLEKGDVIVVDEAGMVSSKQLARIIARVEDAGAKIVLVGDAEQLQPIEAGAAFRAISERVGLMELEGIRRQTEDWAQEASRDFARGRVGKALDAYNDRGHVTWSDTREAAHEALVADWLADGGVEAGSSLALAHSNADVFMINGLIREARKERGELNDGIEYQTSRGVREFAGGDRLLLLKNDRDVKNGMLGTVESVSPDVLTVKLDFGRTIEVKPDEYDTFDHGYAATVHKSQGATVDRAYVLATWGMDRHLAYVAMSRHRDAVTLYANRKDFSDHSALTERLGTSGAKGTTLDYEERAEYLERRGHESERTLDPVKAGLFERQIEWVDQQRHRLARLWSRIESAITGIRQVPIVVQTGTAAPAPTAKPTRRLQAGTGGQAGTPAAGGAGGARRGRRRNCRPGTVRCSQSRRISRGPSPRWRRPMPWPRRNTSRPRPAYSVRRGCCGRTRKRLAPGSKPNGGSASTPSGSALK
ncbi:Ti-type conjugative transfer relaxase TraA [Neoaquamicrobium sediminum]|uniref:Ti-type conjugative transfer relaxase TraA n=1 Tax=Neoaquamicrobium sediminum TaxID=1849104 RepID=UPI001565AA53|nr:Ti-type conjugative transfer relaxase TraA [Mesorhizobium sediminum]NRC57283.1 Ti-type conjugative transfer relaxase TraA [Mesorhizobium sediminum]